MSDASRTRLLRAVRPLHDPPGPHGCNREEWLDVLPAQRRAAVLVAIVERDDPAVLLTRRTDQLSLHAGQVSFPGGRAEPDDADAVATALRETREEVGIDASLLQPFGYLDSFETISGFCVTPVVAWLDPAYAARPDPNEVAEVFEVPLSLFVAPENLRRLRVEYQGRPREIIEFAHAGPRIWGATAAMLLNLVQRLGAQA